MQAHTYDTTQARGTLPYEITWERPFGVYQRFSGLHNPDDVTRVIEIVTSDAGFDDLRYVIVDLLAATGHSFDITSRAALEVPYAMLIGASYTNPHIHVAAVATHPDPVQLIELKIARGVLPHSAQVVATETAARDWLGSISGKFRGPTLG